MNFEDLLAQEFGQGYAIADGPAVALQFSTLRIKEQREALRRLEASTATDLLDFIQTFRAGLPAEILESSKYSLRVLLLPKPANRKSAADLSMEFVPPTTRGAR